MLCCLQATGYNMIWIDMICMFEPIWLGMIPVYAMHCTLCDHCPFGSEVDHVFFWVIRRCCLTGHASSHSLQAPFTRTFQGPCCSPSLLAVVMLSKPAILPCLPCLAGAKREHPALGSERTRRSAWQGLEEGRCWGRGGVKCNSCRNLVWEDMTMIYSNFDWYIDNILGLFVPAAACIWLNRHTFVQSVVENGVLRI